MKTLDDYRELFEDHMRRIKPYTYVLEEEGTLRTVRFINKSFEEQFIEQLREDICMPGPAYWSLGPRLGYECFSAEVGSERTGARDPEYWSEDSRMEIEAWFAKRYPGEDPWEG